jgi:hypothetical protein
MEPAGPRQGDEGGHGDTDEQANPNQSQEYCEPFHGGLLPRHSQVFEL